MAIPNRNEVPEELKWDLTRIFKNDEEWEQASEGLRINSQEYFAAR